MKVSVYSFEGNRNGKTIGVINDADNISISDLKLRIYNMFSFWINENNIKKAICKILFIYPEGENIEWMKFSSGYEGVCLRYYHEFYIYEDEKIKDFKYV